MQPGLRKRIYDFIAQRGLRKTTQRDAIIEAAFSTTEHYTAEELLLMARALPKGWSRMGIEVVQAGRPASRNACA